MTQFTIIDSVTGRVLYGGEASDPAALVTDGQAVVLDEQHSSGYFVEGVHMEEGNPPDRHSVFDYSVHQWVDPRTLQDFKDAQWELIKSAREAAIDAPLVTPYGTFDSGPKDRTNLTDAILMVQTLAGLGMPSDIDFTLADNTTVTITMAQLVEVGLLLGAKVQAAYSRGRVVRQLIEDATTPAEVQAITWEA